MAATEEPALGSSPEVGIDEFTSPDARVDPLSRAVLTNLEPMFSRLQQSSLPASVLPVVLLTTGSYCPVHKQHLRMHYDAAAHLNTWDDIAVLGSFISPSHDDYVGSKMARSGRPLLQIDERVKLLQFAVREEEEFQHGLQKFDHRFWIDRWEGSQKSFVDFPSVLRHLIEFIDAECKRRGAPRIRVLFCVGMDMLKTNVHRSFPGCDLGLVVVKRHGSELSKYGVNVSDLNREQQRKSLVFFADSSIEHEISSSQVFARASSGKPFEDLCHTSVHSWLQENWAGKPKAEKKRKTQSKLAFFSKHKST